MPSVNINKFNNFVQNLADGAINLNTDTLMILLTNTAPVAADTVVDTTTTTCTVKSSSNAAEITPGSGTGYTKGGAAPTNTGVSQSGGIAKLILQPYTWTAAGAGFGPFRYVVLYDNTAGTSSTRPVIGWYDYGSSVTLTSVQTFSVPFDTTNGVFTIQ
jgi:hypothetical protein